MTKAEFKKNTNDLYKEFKLLKKEITQIKKKFEKLYNKVDRLNELVDWDREFSQETVGGKIYYEMSPYIEKNEEMLNYCDKVDGTL